MFIFAILLTLLGVGTLYATWRRNLPRYGALVGWLLVLVGGAILATVAGTDRGIALSLVVLCLSGLAFVWVSATQQRRSAQATPLRTPLPTPTAAKNGRRMNTARPAKGSSISLKQRIGQFILAGPVAGLLAFSVAVLAHQTLLRGGVEAANALVIELFLFPVLWASLVTWVFMASALRNAAFKIGALAFFSAGCLALLDTRALT